MNVVINWQSERDKNQRGHHGFGQERWVVTVCSILFAEKGTQKNEK